MPVESQSVLVETVVEYLPTILYALSFSIQNK